MRAAAATCRPQVAPSVSQVARFKSARPQAQAHTRCDCFGRQYPVQKRRASVTAARVCTRQEGLLVKWSKSPNDFQIILVFACRICNCVIRINSNCTLLNSVCQLVAHLHVFLVHAVITLQPLQQQLYFHNKKFDGQVFLVQKRHNADNMCLWVPASESARTCS